MQAISGLGNFTVSIQLPHRGTMTMFQPPALYQPPAVGNKAMTKNQAALDNHNPLEKYPYFSKKYC
ncbi:MAG: hypothetical protein HPY60_11100 [Candidatus Methanofastidiosum sp.]|nr:hypothetical protein [Methanofastidiosum sp.]